MDSKLYRPKKDRVIAGVCTGLSEYFKIDVAIIRLIFIVLAVYAGSGVLIYIILWIVMPEESGESYAKVAKDSVDKEQIKQNIKHSADEIKNNIKNVVKSTDNKSRNSVAFAVILIILGLIFLTNNIFPALSFSRIWPLAIIAIGIILLVSSNKKE